MRYGEAEASVGFGASAGHQRRDAPWTGSPGGSTGRGPSAVSRASSCAASSTRRRRYDRRGTAARARSPECGRAARRGRRETEQGPLSRPASLSPCGQSARARATQRYAPAAPSARSRLGTCATPPPTPGWPRCGPCAPPREPRRSCARSEGKDGLRGMETQVLAGERCEREGPLRREQSTGRQGRCGALLRGGQTRRGAQPHKQGECASRPGASLSSHAVAWRRASSSARSSVLSLSVSRSVRRSITSSALTPPTEGAARKLGATPL